MVRPDCSLESLLERQSQGARPGWLLVDLLSRQLRSDDWKPGASSKPRAVPQVSPWPTESEHQARVPGRV